MDEIKETFLKNFYKNYYAEGKRDFSRECEQTMGKEGNEKTKGSTIKEQWDKYKGLILNGEMKLDLYTNAEKNGLMNFIAYQSRVFIYCGTLVSNYWMVRYDDEKSKDGKSKYYIHSESYLKEIAKKEKVDKENRYVDEKTASDYFVSRIKPLLEKIVKGCQNGSLDDLKGLENDKWYDDYSGKILLVKMIVMESALDENCNVDLKYKLPIIIKSETIDRIYDYFFEKKTANDIVSKGVEIMKTCYELFEIEQADFDKQLRVSALLWDLFNVNLLDVTEQSPNEILYGSPGTGKTYTVNKGLEMIVEGQEKDRVERVQCHPGFGYEEFVEGLKPVGMQNGTIQLEIVNGAFKKLCIKAKKECLRYREAIASEDAKDSEKVLKEFYFVADEINRADLSAMFGEALSLLEPDYRDDPTISDEKTRKKRENSSLVSTPLSELIEAYINGKIKSDRWKKKDIDEIAYYWEQAEGTEEEPKKVKNVRFGVPKNIRFIGMMNDVDKSIDAFDLALRRRFKWIRTDCDYEALERFLEQNIKSESKDIDYIENCRNLNNFISQKPKKGDDALGFGRSYEFGHAYFMKIKLYVNKSTLQITSTACGKLFDELLLPVLTEYIRSFKDESEIEKYIEAAKKIFTAKSKEEAP